MLYILKKQPSLYSENNEDKIPSDILKDFLKNNKGIGIIGILGSRIIEVYNTLFSYKKIIK